MTWLDKELDDTMPAKRHVGPMSKSWHDRLGLPPNNSMEPPPLRFAKHPEGRGSSTDPGQSSAEFGAILVLAGRAAPHRVLRKSRGR